MSKGLKNEIKTSSVQYIVGACIASVVSIFIWALAYFGYIDLRLPTRFNYEKLEASIKDATGGNTNFSTREVKGFRNDSSITQFVLSSHGKGPGFSATEDEPDDLLIFDQTADSWNMSYKYSPVVEPSVPGEKSASLHIVRFESEYDFNFDGRKDIAVEWSYPAASHADSFLTVFIYSNSEVKVLTIPKLRGFTYPDKYKFSSISNKFNELVKVEADPLYGYFYKDGTIATLFRDPNDGEACSACGEDHIYHVNFFTIGEDDKLRESWEPVVHIKGATKLTEVLKSKGFVIISDS